MLALVAVQNGDAGVFQRGGDFVVILGGLRGQVNQPEVLVGVLYFLAELIAPPVAHNNFTAISDPVDAAR